MGVISTSKIYGVTIRESADDGSDFTNPDADYRRLFLGEDGTLKTRDSAGTVATVSGSGIAATLLDAKGDLIAASAADTAARLAVGANDAVLVAASGETTGLKWRAGAWTSYTPTLSASPTPPGIGNGTLSGRYRMLDDKTVAVEISFIYGSTSTAGSGTWNFDLPVDAAGDTALSAFILDSGVGYFAATGIITSAFSLAVVIFAVADTSAPRNLTQAVPVTPASGDRFVVAGIYRAA